LILRNDKIVNGGGRSEVRWW